MSYSYHKMSLSHPNTSINKQRIISVTRVFRYSFCGCISHLVAAGYRIIFKGKTRADARALEHLVYLYGSGLGIKKGCGFAGWLQSTDGGKLLDRKDQTAT